MIKSILAISLFSLSIITTCAQTDSIPSFLKIDSINSIYLQEYRKVITYFPENYSPEMQYPIIYATDGQLILESDYKSLLDSLISKKKIPPLILIGAYSNENEVGQNLTLRNYEYVKNSRNEGKYGDLYDKHLNFFLFELNQYLENNLKVRRDTIQSIFYGCSNGGGFGISLFIDYRNRFNSFMCFSPLGISYEGLKRDKNEKTNLIISYGDKENFILINAFEELDQKLKKKKIQHTYYSYKGGHDRALWKKEFGLNLVKLFDENGYNNK